MITMQRKCIVSKYSADFQHFRNVTKENVNFSLIIIILEMHSFYEFASNVLWFLIGLAKVITTVYIMISNVPHRN